ncbi:oxidoreductase [Microdochium bolleyi]|uniref:Oxidoreductase n=1 Tax=Microdochium bolleyi TaxID=196109 RepID=A0A136IQH5_9PEZI|nr:oxidoreductase [Microdochium bolleyi]
MSKTKKNAKRKLDQASAAAAQSQHPHQPAKRQHLPSPPTAGSPAAATSTPPAAATLASVVSSEELDIAVETLQALAQNPAVIKAKACRDLRAAVYDFRQACTTGTGSTSDAGNLTSRISAALVDGKHTDALVLLAEMRIRTQAPKLGALCRWVRDLDVTSGLSSAHVDLSSASTQLQLARSPQQRDSLRVLDAILRVTGTRDLLPSANCLSVDDPIALHQRWDLRQHGESEPVRQSVLDGTIAAHCPPGVPDNFHIIDRTPATERKPPNAHDAVVYLSADNSVPLSPTPPVTTLHKHPAVPNLSVMQDVLSSNECKSIIAACEKVGFLPDAPLRDDGAEASILAHNVYWMVDQAFHDALWDRVKAFIPAELEGRKARGINRRFRVYRYVPGAEYRCHFDGAWPPSGVHPTTGKYVYDASPPDAKQSSLFTFLVYLNDDFEGGETTFFTPSLREGVMNAYPVRPVMGSIALFPHGESKGALLHEGTGVREGAKYIIRTDVEYDV